MAISSLVARSLIRSALPKLFLQGYTANRALAYMKTQIGQGYRRQLFLADWREISGVEKVKESFRYIPKKYRLSFGLTVPRAGKMSTNYQYLFRVKGIDAKTFEEVYVWTSMLDDVRMSPAEAEAIMLRQIQDPALETDPQAGMSAYDLELFVVYRTREVIYRR